MIIDGRMIADDIIAGLKARREAHGKPVTLGIIVGSKDPVIDSFVRIKSKVASDIGVELIRCDLPEGAGTEEAIQAVRECAPKTDALIVQLPLPAHIDTNAVLTEVPAAKDIDGISPIGSVHTAPVALAVMEILDRTHVNPQGKRAVVVGAGRLVGSPTAVLLRKHGADVSTFTLDEGKIEDLAGADIVVLGAGSPGFIKPEHIKDGVVLIDAGTSEVAGMIQGDADPACAEKASVFTPVPGGVGPIAVAKLFSNLLDAVQKPQ